jgi:two-component system phosphate regulon sensor histidine kinase PhoR
MVGFTPREIGRRLTFYLVGIIAFLGIAFTLVFANDWRAWIWLIATLITMYFIVMNLVEFTIERFINRRIRLIYRTINKLRATKSEDKTIDLSTDVIGNVNRDVLEWAQHSNQEIKQLKELARFRKEFIGNLAHELRTPACLLQGYILTLLEGGLEDPNINRKYLERADKNLDRLISLINDIHQITKIESGEEVLNITRFDVVQLVRDIVDSEEFMANQKGIELQVERERKPLWVLADRDKIEQVLSNLITNSIRYGIDGGKTMVQFDELDDEIIVEIEDNGVGIKEEHLPRLFERFYRVDKSRSRHLGGTGLGLAIVKHILDAHNQTISVRSQPGEGSAFSFTLKTAES